MARRHFMQSCAAVAAIGTTGDTLGDTLDEAGLGAPIFTSSFNTLPIFRPGIVHPEPPRSLADPAFQWTAGYIHATRLAGGPAWLRPGQHAPAFSTLHDELEIYPNADAIAETKLNPFAIDAGALVITATPTPEHLIPIIPDGMPKAYISGAITSYPFAQTYGYFELRGRIPAGRGLWPAFWLLPSDMSWPPEIDVMEVLGDRPSTLYTTLHSRRLPIGKSEGFATITIDLSKADHAFGVDWGPARVRYYLDRRLVFSRPTPADWHKPFYLLANLAVGATGSWPGPPDATTRFPARFRIASIRAWQRAAHQAG